MAATTHTNDSIRVSGKELKFGNLSIVLASELPDIADVRTGDIYIIDSSAVAYSDPDDADATPETVGFYQAGTSAWITLSDGASVGTATYDIDALGLTVSDSYTQTEIQSIADKVDEIITALVGSSS